jgi:hypothetical protein
MTTKVKPLVPKVERFGAFGCYEVTGWRYEDDVRWHVKVWPAGSPREWLGYTVTRGSCELSNLSQAQRSAFSDMISRWET